MHRLGAIELIELGKSDRDDSTSLPVLRRPFLGSSRPMLANQVQLGALDFLGDIGSFLTGEFESLFETLASIVDLPLDIASSGVGLLFDKLVSLLVNVPILGVAAAEILLLGKAVLQWGLSVPGLALEDIGNIFSEIKNAIDATKTVDEQKRDAAEAKSKILARAEQRGGVELREAVKATLEGNAPDAADVPTRRTDLPAGADQVGVVGKSDVEKLLEIGIPIAGAATLVFLVLT